MKKDKKDRKRAKMYKNTQQIRNFLNIFEKSISYMQ